MARLAGRAFHCIAAGGDTSSPVICGREMFVMAVEVAAAQADTAITVPVLRPVVRQVAAEGQLPVAHSLLYSPA